MKLLIATHNPGKLAEMMQVLKKLKNIQVVSLFDLKIKGKPDEKGVTFEENSLEKAKYYARLSGLPTISDDGGIMIRSLNNEPGVISRMWLGRDATDEELIEHALKRLQGFPKNKRKAKFETCVTFYDPERGKFFQQKESIKGYIAEKANNVRVPGYPFRSLFIYEEFNKYYNELTPKEHLLANHRLRALRRLSKKISSYLLQ